MSGPPVLAARKGTATSLVLPRVQDPVTAAQINLIVSVIEQYEAQRSARQTQQIPNFAALQLISPNGTTYQLNVVDNGGVYVTPVPRAGIPRTQGRRLDVETPP